jgi:hypothetical protein
VSRYLATLAARASGRVALLSPRPRTLYEGGGEDTAFEEPAQPIAGSVHPIPRTVMDAPSAQRESTAPRQGTTAPAAAPTIRQGSVVQVTQVLTSAENPEPRFRSQAVPPIQTAIPSGERPAIPQPPADPGHTPALTPPPAQAPDRPVPCLVPNSPSPNLQTSERTVLQEIVRHVEVHAPAGTPPDPDVQAPPPRTAEPAPRPLVHAIPRPTPAAPQPRQRSVSTPRGEPPVIIRIERIDVHTAPPPPVPPPARRQPASPAPSPGPSLAEFLSGGERAR